VCARRRLFAPLGMSSSAYVEDILKGTGERAIGYQKEGTGWKRYMRLGNERGGGAVVSTIEDLLVWNEALSNGRLGKFVAAKLEERATLRSGRKLTYARGLMVSTDDGERMVSHSGGAAGYSSWLGRFPERGVSVVVLCNFDPVSASALGGRVADLFLPPADARTQAQRPVATPGIDVTGRAGVYFDARGEPLRLLANNGRLAIANGPPLVPVSADRFVPPRASPFFRSEDAFELTFRSNDELELKSMEGQTTRYRRAQPWAPSAADLQGADGRYHSEELGTVFELLPSTNRLVLRSERSPAQSVELEAVAPDTYMRSLMSVRLRRDVSGKVTGFDYGNPLVRSLRFTRLGDRRAGGAPSAPVASDPVATTSAAPTASASSAPGPGGLVGEYELAPGRTVAITLEGGQLHSQPSGGQKRLLVHVSGTTFTVGGMVAPLTLAFTLGADGRATTIVMRQNGNERTLTRVR